MSFEAFTGDDPALQGGDADNLAVSISHVELQGNSSIDLPSPGVTAFVGGNNVGKSTILRQLATWVGSRARAALPGPVVISSVDLAKSGNSADLLAWLYTHRTATTQQLGPGIVHPSGFLPVSEAVGYWTQGRYANRMASLGAALTYYADTQQRLAMSQPAARRDDFTEPPTNPLQALEDNPGLLEELSRIAHDAFGQALILDPLSRQLILRVGKSSVAAPPVDAITRQYRTALSELAPLHEQGDGMRSMMGLLLPIVASTYPLVIVDEPEAFLHPPQARILGRELASLAHSRRIQIVLATHDRHILTGLMDANAPVSIVRLTRHESQVTASQLASDALSSVWADPSLRYSNILDGLFHRAVVLAENERDCRFFSAAVEVAHREDPLPISPHDILFVPTAGKTNMRPLAATMRACGVPTVASADLDLLNDEGTIRALLEALGGDWSEVASDFTVATAQFRLPKSQRQNRDVLGAVASVLQEFPEANYDGDTQKRVQQALAVDKPWQAVKDFGINAFRSERQRADALIATLDERGIVLAEEGELEGFARDLEVRKGPGWVPAALKVGAHELQPAREHVGRLLRAALTQESALLENATEPLDYVDDDSPPQLDEGPAS